MTPPLSVVVPSVNGFPYLGECLDALASTCPEAEVIVADCTDAATRRRVVEEWPAVKLVVFHEPTTIPALRAAGIVASSAPYVAMIEDHCVVRNGWAAGVLAAHGSGNSVVGGPIRNRATRLRDWAAFLFEYSAYMEPVERGATTDLPGMNVSYDREAIAAIVDLLEEAKWESWLHARLRERGFVLHLTPDVTIDHVKDFGILEFVAQRFHYARAYAAMRNDDLGRRRALYAAAAPAIIPLVYARISRNVLQRRRHVRELVLATPLLLVYLLATALGESIGYASGGGNSLLRVK
jgi:glycosyltransferase involved in cell wall biosynthesis